MTRPLSLGLAFVLLVCGLTLWLVEPGALWTRLVLWIGAMQRELHQALATGLRAVREDGAMAGPGLIATGFLYGIFHAAGPGHGKVVITTYLATQRESLGRGIALATIAALAQGLVAILAVMLTLGLLERTARQSQALATSFEQASFAVLMLLGLFLVWRHGRRLHGGKTKGHHHEHHHHGHACRHHHAPPPDRAFWAGVATIGLRPCTGAILILVLATSLGLKLAGVLAVLAMSAGTALTVSGFAALAVLAREHASRLADQIETDGARLARIADTLAILGGLLLATMGLALLHASLTVPSHPLF